MGGSAMGGSAGSSLNTYASIDFYKSEELRAHQSSRKDGQELRVIGVSSQPKTQLSRERRRLHGC
ncbi:hypothetical protein GBF38_019128 [Nibea albiflora]|uniref:Uncharacterized protein n=1 Tax=Nibea albiflora TaxID=240163 RepID=A0ACB7F1Q5_NIBAL|nr:hypothetical protein GBF38_019128 [Nibea albiflora]